MREREREGGTHTHTQIERDRESDREGGRGRQRDRERKRERPGEEGLYVQGQPHPPTKAADSSSLPTADLARSYSPEDMLARWCEARNRQQPEHRMLFMLDRKEQHQGQELK